ncbi:hypothetical protein P615_06165 [Brevibacillus laterosporus PE36]|nr:hypothetical protein P615_06165 [Brevibacillus laterosporus PE36]
MNHKKSKDVKTNGNMATRVITEQSRTSEIRIFGRFKPKNRYADRKLFPVDMNKISFLEKNI